MINKLFTNFVNVITIISCVNMYIHWTNILT